VHAEVHRHLAGGHVEDRRGHVVGTDCARTAGDQAVDVALGLRRPAHGAVEDHGDAVGLRLEIESGVGHGLAGGDHRELREPSRPARALGAHLVLSVEALDLAGDPDGEIGGVEGLDRADPRAALDQPAPGLRGAPSQRRERADPGHDRIVSVGRLAQARAWRSSSARRSY
jgi:hypothetical protein